MEKQCPHWGMRVGASQPLTCPLNLEAHQAGAPRPLLGPQQASPCTGGPTLVMALPPTQTSEPDPWAWWSACL